MHDTTLDTLTASARSGTLAHAVMLLGPHGIGKSRAAHALAAALLGCETHALAAHPEYIHVEPEEHAILVDQIRTLGEQTSGAAFSSSRRVIFIEHLERATQSAANALLKALEEPRKQTHFILTAEHTQTIPATLLSRCAIIPLAHAPDDELQSIVAHIEPTLAKKMLTWAAGRPALLLEIAHNEEVQEQWARSAHDLRELLTAESAARLAWVEALPKSMSHEEAIRMIDRFVVMLRALIFSHARGRAHLLAQLAHALDAAAETKVRLEKHVQQRGLLDMLVLSLPKL